MVSVVALSRRTLDGCQCAGRLRRSRAHRQPSELQRAASTIAQSAVSDRLVSCPTPKSQPRCVPKYIVGAAELQLERHHLGDTLRLRAPCLGGIDVNLDAVAVRVLEVQRFGHFVVDRRS